MQKSKIEWTDYTWNPIKGICPTGCFYCYARKIYERFHFPTKLSWDGRVPILSNKKPRKIFVCSTMEMFHPDIPREWRDRIFKIIEADYNKEHTFQILTKFPQNINQSMPNNCWIGTTITSPEDFESRSYHLGKKEVKARLKFWSIEPLLGDIIEPMLDKDGSWKYITEEEKIRWIIIGCLTGYGHKYDPKWDWVNHIVSYAKHYHIPVFLKDNLIPIMGKEYVMKFREFPK